ncbi:MAG: hypothetical protein AAFN65_04790 [Bacteroidota bacterium]
MNKAGAVNKFATRKLRLIDLFDEVIILPKTTNFFPATAIPSPSRLMEYEKTILVGEGTEG